MKLIDASDLKQRHVEDFAEYVRVATNDGDVSMVKYRGETVRAAIKAGWMLDEKSPDVVDDMPPAEVFALSEKIAKLYEDATTVPKE